MEIESWLDQQGTSRHLWYVKRLSANDTLANGGHQAGPYVPKKLLLDLFPTINSQTEKNPRHVFALAVDSHDDARDVTAIYYNGKFFRDEKTHKTGTRNEARLTGFGGKASALLDPDHTGALTVFSFEIDDQGAAHSARVWVARDGIEEDAIEARTGEIEPGENLVWTVASGRQLSLFGSPKSASCSLAPGDIPAAWLERFPKGLEIVEKAIAMRDGGGLFPQDRLSPDERLLSRRTCEYEIFRSVEEATYLPGIKAGFDTLESFVRQAQSILQSRKSRSGRSLELHVRAILIEEGLVEGVDFEHGPVIENGKKPDFIFPNAATYDDDGSDHGALTMLAVKTTCKDRWRQILNEADRLKTKHLLTLQEGVSVTQFAEMRAAGVQLVVPRPLHRAYPKTVQSELMDLSGFIGLVPGKTKLPL